MTGEPDREPANRDRTVAPPTVPRFPRFNCGTVEPWSQTMAHGSTTWNRGAKPWPTVPRFNRGTVQTVAHGSTVQPWNRGAKPWPTVPRFNRGTVDKPWPTVPRFNRGTVETNRGPRFHGSTVEPWSQTVAYSSTFQPWNRGGRPWVLLLGRVAVAVCRSCYSHGLTIALHM